MSKPLESKSKINSASSIQTRIEDELFLSLLPSDKTKTKALNFRGIKPSIDSTKAFQSAKGKIEDEGEICRRAENNIDYFIKKSASYKEKVKKLEEGLKLLLKVWLKKKDNCKPETFTLLAKVYLLRSRVFRPRGFTIPKKKEEALSKGLDFIKKIKELEWNQKALQIKAMLYLESERIKVYYDDFEDILKSAIDSMDEGKVLNDIFNIWICLRYCEEINSDYDDLLEELTNLKLDDIPFENARAYYILDNLDEMKSEMKKAIQGLDGVRFSNPIWNDIVEFLKKLKDKDIEGWEKLALQSYEVCEEQSQRTSNIFLRLYWSGLRDLYDLAFLAAGDTQEGLKQKAKIADSLKNRPATRYSVWKNEITDKAELEAEENSLIGGYIRDIPKLSLEQNKKHFQSELKDLTSIPSNSVAIHFYYNNLEQKGYAIIYDKDTNDWKLEPFECEIIYKSYRTWQDNYNREGINNVDVSYLLDLCKCIGHTLRFLFEIKVNKSIYFIPHDFIRRLPLHGAIKNNGNGEEILLEQHKCFYLPTWYSTTIKKEDELENKFIIQYPVGNLFIELAGYKFLQSLDELYKLEKSPQILIISCIGKADDVNPFNSKLLINKDGKTLRELLLEFKVKLNGSCVLIGACESDFIPTLTSPIDEHLSLSLPFLNNGASEIISTMWEIYPEDLRNIVLKDASINSLWMWQKEKIDDYKNGDSNSFYKALAFRVISSV
jgi:hypothetical protein